MVVVVVVVVVALPLVLIYCVTDVRAIRELIPDNFCVESARSQKVPYEGARVHKRIPARKSCVTDVLCN